MTLAQELIPKAAPAELDLQLKQQRRTVDFDTFDIQVQQLLSMLDERQILIAPAYQRKFRWKEKSCSQLIESLLLGIPVPSLFMATNDDNTWEVVDGLQRLSAIVKFAGSDELRKRIITEASPDALALADLQKLKLFDGLKFTDLPPNIQNHFKTRPLKVITLNDKSDSIVRYDLFERLNTGGVPLSPQEIRDCVFGGKFSEKLEELSKSAEFKKVVKLTDLQKRDGTAEECVLRFFSFLDRYKTFVHSVEYFLTDYMKDASKNFDFEKKEKVFKETFLELSKAFPSGIQRLNRKGTTSLILFEAVAVGAALALQKTNVLRIGNLSWIGHPALTAFTTGATNSPKSVKGRIEFCRDRFLGKPYVESAKN